jgi:hypothetical protein
VIWPQATPIQGAVDTTAGTITLTVPGSLLHPLSGTDSYGRPLQGTPSESSTYQDGAAFSFANTQPKPSTTMGWMEQLDNTPAFNFSPQQATTSTTSGGKKKPKK